MLDSEGIIVKPCATDVFVDRIVDLWEELPNEMGQAIEPVLNSIAGLTEEIKACDKKLKESIAEQPSGGPSLCGGPPAGRTFLRMSKLPASGSCGCSTV